ncbi:hypothetical protein FSP39_006657 [Pinctada imbricata]|uniref:Uncharacterized protein n=1 Tax=Pinctada imbricata TaxID=66713 RepID=A0AA88Y321_PINIB|nr:hypothetical protein FSP39_006657 [Pinctada imbricata]
MFRNFIQALASGVTAVLENRSEVTAHSEAEPGNVNTNAVQPPSITQDMSLIGSQSELCTSALGNHSELSTSAFEEIQVPQKESEDLNPDLNSSGSIEVISTETVSEVKVSMTDTLVITDSMIFNRNVPMPGRKAKQTDWKQRKNRNTYKSEWSYKPGEMCRDVRLETNPNLPVYRTNAATKVEKVEGAKEDTAERVLKEQSESLKEDLGRSVEKKEDVEEIKAEGNKEPKKGEVKMPEIKLAATKDEEFGKKGLEDSVSEREVEVAVKVSCESENVMATAQCVKEKTEATGTVEKGLSVDENKKNNSDVKESEDEFKDECSLIDENAVKEVESKVYENEPVCSNEEERQKKPSEVSAGKTSPEELKEKRIENESRISKAGKKGVDQNDKNVSESSTNGEDEKEQKDSDQKDNFKSYDETKAEEKRELDKAKWDEAMDGWIQATRKGRKARSRGVSENDGQLVSHHVAASGDGNKHSSSTENVSDSVTDYESLLADWKKDTEKHKLKKRNSDSGEKSLVKTPTSTEKKTRTFVSKMINSPNSPISYAAAVTSDSPPEGMRGSNEQKEGGEKISSSPVNAVGREIGRSIETCKEDTKVKSSSNGGKKELLENSDSAGKFCSKGKEDRVANVELNDLDISDAEREVSKLVSEITSKVLAEAETEAGVLEEQIMRENSSKEAQDSRDIPFEDSAIISEGRKLSKAPEGMSLPLASLERGAEESERSNSPEEFISLLQQVMPT